MRALVGFFSYYQHKNSTPAPGGYQEVSKDELFIDWHNKRYLRQCFSNLQEKFDCGGIPVNQWGEVIYALKDVPLA